MKKTANSIIFTALLALLIVLAAALIANPANASKIDVNVNELISSEQKEISRDLSGNMLKISYDVMNSGSIEYGARIRADLFSGAKYIATLWSKEEAVNPGERKTLRLYWYQQPENGTAALAPAINARLYRAYEIVEIGNFTETFGKGNENPSNASTPNTLEISSVHAYGSEIKFRVKNKSPDSAKNVVVYPIKHPRAWLFEQNEIGDIAAGGEKSASLHYETGAYKEREITLIAASEDGRNYGAKTFVLKKEEGLNLLLGKFQDWLGV